MNEEKEVVKNNLDITAQEKAQSKKSLNSDIIKVAENPVKFLTKKIGFFNVESLGKYSKKIKEKITREGRWSKEEHERFLEGIILYGTNWKKIRELVGTRTKIQICSHAQKFFSKMKTCKVEELGLDFTLDSVCSIKDMINQIKFINSKFPQNYLILKLNKNYNIIQILKYLKENTNNKNLNNENTNKTNYINESFNKNDSSNLATNTNYIEILNHILYDNLNNLSNTENELEYINNNSLLNYYSNHNSDFLLNNYLMCNSNTNCNNLLIHLIKE